VDVSHAIETGFQGRRVGVCREPGLEGLGAFPQETRLLPIIARPPDRERAGVLSSMQIWSPAAFSGRVTPDGTVFTLDEIDLNVAFTPETLKYASGDHFDPVFRTKLFDVGFKLAAHPEGYRWAKVSPG